MPRKKMHALDYIDYTMYLILKLIDTEENKSGSNILNKSNLSSGGFYKKVRTLLDLGLIDIQYLHNTGLHNPKTTYLLTDKGKRVLKLLEELKNTFESKNE
jgi:predicted transcriptional regulator